MNIDLPLILSLIVLGSGAIWAVDALLFSRARDERLALIRDRYPGWERYSADEKQGISYLEEVASEASEPLLVEYAKSFFPILAFVLVLRSFLFEPFQMR